MTTHMSDNNPDFRELRKQAETRIKDGVPVDFASLSNEEAQALFHELQVHQIELELQNDQLRASETRQAELMDELKKSRDLFSQLYHDAPAGYITLDEDGIIIQANMTMAEFAGTVLAAIEKKHFTWLVHPDDHPLFRLKFRSLLKNPEEKNLELKLRRSTNSFFTAHIEAKKVQWTTPSKRDTEQLLLVIHDITVRKEMEQKMLAAKKEAEQASKAKSEFLSQMSHELRTPLNAILGFSQILALDSGDLEDDQADAISQIYNSGEHLLNLVNDVLDISLIESGAVELHPERTDFREILEESLKLITPMAQKHDVTINLQDYQKNFHLFTDRQRLRQALLNLLSNAIKYNREKGSVTISCSEKAALHKGRTIRLLHIDIIDTGIGIETADHGRIFEPFKRIQNREKYIEGTGIGLNITKQIIEMMGGNIGFHSVPGKGSTFWIEIPLTDNVPENNAKTSPAMENKTFSEPKNILYIEDNEQNARLMKSAFAKFSLHKLLIAPNGKTGLVMVKSENPDLVLLDLDLPDISGFDILEKMKSDPSTASIPVISVSALATTEQIKKIEESPFHNYIVKPVNIPRLMELVEMYLPA